MRSLQTALLAVVIAASCRLVEAHTTAWQGFTRNHFTVAGTPAFITQPVLAAPGRPWIWRMSFPDFHPEVDLELLRHGWAIGLMITSGPDAGSIVSRVDQQPERTIDTRTPWSDQLHLPWALMLANNLPDGPHTLRVRVAEGALRIFHFLVNGDPQTRPR